MRITRLFTGTDGQSHFEEIDLPLEYMHPVGYLSENIPVSEMILRETDGDYHHTWHNPPSRQYVVMLDGEVEIIVGDGTRRILQTGDILLAEDITGQGHISRAVDAKPRKSMIIRMP